MELPPILHQFVFGTYPYICLAVFFLGSLVRFDRDQYTWKSDSSQLLREDALRWGSNLFHIGVLFLFFGHLFGLFTPHWAYGWLFTAAMKQQIAIIGGGIAGAMAIIGLTMLIHRRIVDPRVRSNTRVADMALLVILWVQLALGLATTIYAVQHPDGSQMQRLAEWAQRIVTFTPGAADFVVATAWLIKVHLALGLTIFLIFPFTRLVHIWSGFGAAIYLVRPYQIVRTRRKLA